MDTKAKTTATKKNKEMKVYQLFEALGTPLSVYTAWGAYSPETHRAVFTVWDHEVVNGRCVIAAPTDRSSGAGQMRNIFKKIAGTDVETLGISIGTNTPEADWHQDYFDKERLLVLRLAMEEEALVAYIVGEVRAAEVVRGQGAQVLPLSGTLNDLDVASYGNATPERLTATHQYFRRDPEVRRRVIERAEGECEHCKTDGFATTSGPYLEAHHILALANEGPDTTANVIALCANHHRQAHYGLETDKLELAFVAALVKKGARPA